MEVIAIKPPVQMLVGWCYVTACILSSTYCTEGKLEVVSCFVVEVTDTLSGSQLSNNPML